MQGFFVITFDEQSLFSSGPAHVSASGATLRRAAHPTTDGIGVRLIAQGREARSITQVGALVADTPEGLRALFAGIEALMHGEPATLRDGFGGEWPNTVMLKFSPGPITRLGPRVKSEYRIEYLQVTA